MHVEKSGCKSYRKRGATILGAHGCGVGACWNDEGGQGMLSKSNALGAPSPPQVERSLEANDVVSATKVVPIVLHPSNAIIDGSTM